MKKITDITMWKYTYLSYYAAGIVFAKERWPNECSFTKKRFIESTGHLGGFNIEEAIEFKTQEKALEYLKTHLKNLPESQVKSSIANGDVGFIRPVSWVTHTKQKLPLWSSVENTETVFFKIEDLLK